MPIGTLARHDLIQAYNRAVLEDDLAGSTAGRIESSLASRVTETIGGYVLVQTDVPREMQGKTLAELDFRAKYNSQVLLVCGDDEEYALPERNTRLSDGDRILLFGRREDVSRILNL